MKMNARERWFAIGTGVVLGLLVLDQSIYTPLSTRLDNANRIANECRLALIDGDGKLRNSTNARRNWKRFTSSNVADNAPAAESQLLNHVREWMQGSGLTLNAIKPARSDREKNFDKITINATAAGGMEQVSRFLYSVQTSDIPVRVNRIDLTTRKEGADDVLMNIEIASIYGDVTAQTLAAAPGTPARGAAR
jgi:type II secretory pathway component PulM